MRSKDVDQVLTKMTRMFPWILVTKKYALWRFQNRIENSQRIPHRFWENQQSESVLRGFVLSKPPLPLPPLQLLCGGCHYHDCESSHIVLLVVTVVSE